MGQSIGPSPELSRFMSGFLEGLGLGKASFECHSIAGDGSKRVFRRLLAPNTGASFVMVENTPTDTFSKRENLSYLHIGTHLYEKGLPIPQIHQYDLERGWFILEDLGEVSLQDRAKDRANRMQLYEQIIESLLRLQIEGSKGFDRAWTCQTERYDKDVMRRYESNYFKEAYLETYLGLRKDWAELEPAFDYLAETASKADDTFFLHRDFQSRNIMVSEHKIGIVDWQGARLGPLAYDLASLLIDPYTDLSHSERNHIYQTYLHLLKGSEPKQADPFQKYYPYLAIQRNLQILGAFSFLTKKMGKPYFEAFIPPGLRTLYALLHELNDSKLSILEELASSLLKDQIPI